MQKPMQGFIVTPPKPEGLPMQDSEWADIMQQIWLGWWSLYYEQHKEEIDKSLQDFTDRVFEKIMKYAEEATSPPCPDF
jgi:hypothetical protein